MAVIIIAGLLFLSCNSPAQQQVQDGDACFERQEWDDVVVSYLMASRMDPKLELSGKIAAAYNNKASQSFAASDYESAVFNYDKALEYEAAIGPGFDIGYARYKAAMLYLQQGLRTDALRELGASIRAGYTACEAYLARALVYNNLAMYSGAIGDASTCLDLDPRSAEALLLRGYAYLFSGEYARAVDDLSVAIALDAAVKDAYLYRGMALNKQGDFSAAIQDFEHVVEIDPSSSEGLILLGRSYYLSTDYYAAIEQFTRAIQLKGDDVAVAFNDRAVCLGRTGEYNAAVSDLNMLAGMHPEFALAYYNLGVVYMKMNHLADGTEWLDTYLCLDREDKCGCRGLAAGWRSRNINYNLCCGTVAFSGSALERCDRIMAQGNAGQIVMFEKDALYFPTENNWYCW